MFVELQVGSNATCNDKMFYGINQLHKTRVVCKNFSAKTLVVVTIVMGGEVKFSPRHGRVEQTSALYVWLRPL